MSQLQLPMPISGLPMDLRALAIDIHLGNIVAGWWKKDDITGRTLNRNVGELLALVHSEISEADHGFELGLMDDKLPHRRMVEVELADVAIRVLDMLGFYLPADDAPIPIHFDTTLIGAAETDWPTWCRVMHRETTRALEGFRKSKVDVGCNHLIDLLGVIHFCSISFGYDLTGAIEEKRAFNATRADHQLANREKAGGKAF